MFMNLSVLERKVGEGDLSLDALTYLLSCRTECEWLDYKESFSLDTEKGLCDFARDALAFKNVGGGYILVGVKDKTWLPVGLSEPFEFDTKMLRDKLLKASGVSLDIDVVTHKVIIEADKRLFALILVRASRKRKKRRSPTLVEKDYCANKPYGLRRGEIYARRGDTTVRVTTGDELCDILDRLEIYADEGAIQSEAKPAIFAVQEGTYRLLEPGFTSFVGRVALRQRLLETINGDPRIWIINLHGPGGVGKSALANWAAYQMFEQRAFEAILQLTAKETILTDAGIRKYSKSLYSLENLLDHILFLFEEPISDDLSAKKNTAIELLSAWRTLLILDNMETTSDGRILSFVQELPVNTRTRVLLTSRIKSGGWELPVPVEAMSLDETKEFVEIKANELEIDFPCDSTSIRRVAEVSGGLPLATQWIIGQYRRTGRLDQALKNAKGKDSPILEFSFRNVWNVLGGEAKTILAIMSIFDSSISIQDLAIATEMQPDSIEEALSELAEVTLVTRSTQKSDGRTLFSALPVTLSFARHQLALMGDIELRCRRRLQRFNEQMELQSSEVAKFRSEFDRYGLETPNEKRGAILCRRGESEMFSGNSDAAELLFQQARDLAPQSAYIHAKSAAYELARNRVALAMDRITEACKRSNKKTGSLCFAIKARIYQVQKNYTAQLEALAEALKFEPNDPVLRHQYGVALSRLGREEEAVEQFTLIINSERKHFPLRETLVMALTTRIINLKRLNRLDEAREDLKEAREIIKQQPYLATGSKRLEELEAEFTS